MNREEGELCCEMNNNEEKSDSVSLFGRRFLLDQNHVFDHNAWDHMEWTEEQTAEAERIVSEQRAAPVPPETANKLISNPADYWQHFYNTHDRNFFMDRNWLFNEFPELKCPNTAMEQNYDQKKSTKAVYRILEIGCGAGNSVFPILNAAKSNETALFLYCCDFSPKAIEIVKSHPDYDRERCSAFVCDIVHMTDEDIPFVEDSLDVISSTYVLSAISCDNQEKAVRNLIRYLKPGGVLLFKDYGRYDMTQLRFKKERAIVDRHNLYARGDGTLVYYFDQNEVDELFTKAGLMKEQNLIDRRLIVNRRKRIKMYRVWLQCKYRKPLC